jgi:glutathione synthase/RimK-type ligase-like ATP-grasp enzyme
MKKEYVLIFTHGSEINVDILSPLLVKKGFKVVRFNTEEFPLRSRLTTSLDDGMCGIFTQEGVYLSKENVQSCWYRQPWSPEVGKEDGAGYERLIKEESKALLWSLETTLDVFWMNNPLSVHLLDNNKFFQMKTARELGFKVPASLMTNDKDRLLEFCEKFNGQIALKMISGHVFKSKRTQGLFDCVFTQKLSMKDIREKSDRVATCPVFVQEYIEKKIEARITVVGSSVFACAIYSQDSEKTLHDWRRYDFENVKHERLEISDDVSEKLLSFMKKCNLSFGAFDFIITPQGEYVFLEVNTGGQWGWIEDLTGMPISAAIVETLCSASFQ